MFVHNVCYCQHLSVHFMTMSLCVSVHKHPVSHCETDKGFASTHCAMLVSPAPTAPSFFFIITPSQPLCNGGKNNTMLVLSDVACNSESLQNILFFCEQLYISFSFRRKTTTVSSVIFALALYLWNCMFPFGCIGEEEQLQKLQTILWGSFKFCFP